MELKPKKSTDATLDSKTQLVTFDVGHATFALEINYIHEINRNLQVTQIPHAPDNVLGVMNLRGEVVTVLNLHVALGAERGEDTKFSRNLVVNYEGELVGLRVDRVADIVVIDPDRITAPPANLEGAARRLTRGVIQTEERLIMLIDLFEILGRAETIEIG